MKGVPAENAKMADQKKEKEKIRSSLIVKTQLDGNCLYRSLYTTHKPPNPRTRTRGQDLTTGWGPYKNNQTSYLLIFNCISFLPRKKRVSRRVLRRAMHIIRSETLGRRLASAKSLAKSLAKVLWFVGRVVAIVL